MKELKFRVWDKLNKRWLEENTFIDSHGLVFIDESDTCEVVLGSILSPIIINQYIGNIYENGDMIK